MKRNKKYSLIWVGFVSIFLVSLFGCSSNNKIDSQHVFRLNVHENINTLDPAYARDLRSIWAMNQIFNGLVRLDDELNIQPDIATHWEISEDAKTYLFYLRDDVYFHTSEIFGDQKTRVVTASDFVYSFDRIKDKKIASPGLWTLESVKHYEAVDDNTLKIELTHPFSPFLGILSMKHLSVLPKELDDLPNNTISTKPIGTGPFYVKAWMQNLKMVLRKNQLYFETNEKGEQLPHLESVAITFVPDKQSEFLLFLQGKLDMINSLDASYKDELLDKNGQLQTKYINSVKLLRSPYLNTEYIGIYLDNNKAEIQSIALRKALNYGLDRKEMIRFLKNNIGSPATKGFIPDGLNTNLAVQGYSYDMKKAKELVEQFRVDTGIQNPTLTLATDDNYVDLCTYLQNAYNQIGITINIEVMPSAALREAKSNGKLELFRASWVADYPDPENYLLPYFSENFSPNGPNYTHFKSKAFDEGYKEIAATLDADRRNNLITSLDQQLVDKAPFILLYYDEVLRFIQPNVEGMIPSPVNMLDLRRVKKRP
ncbi:MAG: ABC transporter substrate-binding protein [Flavobacteriaceae bacterium]